MITAVISTALSIVREKETRHDGAGADGADLDAGVRRRQDACRICCCRRSAAHRVISGGDGASSTCRCAAAGSTLSVVLALFLVGALGTGLLVSTIADTQQVAFQAAMLVAFLPTFILSGFIFPIASMPVALQYISTIVPARYFLIALRGIVLKGLDLPSLWEPLLALGVYAVVVLGLSAVRLRTPMIQRIRTLMWKEFLELRQTPRLLRTRHRRADAAVDDAGLCGDDRCARTCRSSSWTAIDRRAAGSCIERFAASPYFEIVGEEMDPRARGRRPRAAAARGWRSSCRRVSARRSSGRDAHGRRAADDAGDRRRDRRQLVRRRAGVRAGPRRRVQRGARGRARAARLAGDRRRASASGSTRSSRAGTSWCPGVLALLLLVITANLTSMAIVRERELGTLEQLNVTPLGRWELILGQAAAVRARRLRRRAARRGGRRLLVRGAAARQRLRCCSAQRRLPAAARSGWGCSSRRSRRRSSRR